MQEINRAMADHLDASEMLRKIKESIPEEPRRDASIAETRLEAYYAAELAILSAQEARSGDSTRRMAELRDDALQTARDALSRLV